MHHQQVSSRPGRTCVEAPQKAHGVIGAMVAVFSASVIGARAAAMAEKHLRQKIGSREEPQLPHDVDAARQREHNARGAMGSPAPDLSQKLHMCDSAMRAEKK